MLDSEYWVWFQVFFGFVTKRTQPLLEEFKSPKVLYEKIKAGDYPQGLLQKSETESFGKSLEKAKRVIHITQKKGCHIITPGHEDYPELLQHIYGKPAALYVKGDLGVLRERLAFTMVGARNYSNYGEEATRELAGGLAQNNTVVISGIAKGIDSISLEEALDNGGKAIGVLPCGLDFDYPKESGALKRKICENGAVITEYPMGMKPMPYMFGIRNRIMAGMSNGVVVIQAGDRSGSLVTAKHGFDSDREVFVVPDQMFSGTFSGSHNLIKLGIGKLVTNVSDILSEYPEYQNAMENHSKDNSEEKPEKKKKSVLPRGMDKIIYKIYDIIDESNQTADQISEKTNEDISDILGAVTMLEILGVVVGKPGGFFTLK